MLLTLAVALAGCGQATPPARSSTSPAPAASGAIPTLAERALLAVADDAGPGNTALGLYALDGARVARVTLSASTRSGWPGVGGGLLTFVDNGVLKGLTPAGAVQTLGPVAGWSGGPVVVSPDGRQWMWSTSSTGPSGATSSRLVLGTAGAPDRVVAQETAVGRSLQPFRWTAAGPTYQNAPLGIGGYILFDDSARGPSFRFDAGTGQVSPVLEGRDCMLADLAADGTIACFRLADHSIAVLAPDGHTVAVPLPLPAFTQEGAVTFTPGPTAAALVIGGATSAGASGGPERYETDVLDVASRALRGFGPAGLRPASGPSSWLPDGSLVAYRPLGAAGGDPGVYVIGADGAARRVLSSGTPLGVVVARG